MFLKQFNTTDLQRKTPEVLDSALENPVVITKRGKDSFIVMTKEEFIKLRTDQDKLNKIEEREAHFAPFID